MCDPCKDETDFIEALRVVDECTAENTIWDLLVPRVKANLQTLLKNEAFKEVVKEQSALTFQLLGSFASGSQAQPSSDGESPVYSAVELETPARKRSRLSEGQRESNNITSVAPAPNFQQNTSTPTRGSFGQGIAGLPPASPFRRGILSGGQGARGGPDSFLGRGRGRGRGSGNLLQKRSGG